MVCIYEAQYVEAAARGKLLASDPDLQRLAARHGFRTADPAAFTDTAAEHQPPVQPDLIDVVDTPTYDTFENLLEAVSTSYR